MTYFWTWFNVLTMGIDGSEMDRELDGEIARRGGEPARRGGEPARSLAALKVRGRMVTVAPCPAVPPALSFVLSLSFPLASSQI